MPDSAVAENVGTTTSTPPAPTSPQPTTPATEAPKESAANTVSETPPAPDWRTAIDSVDVKELLKHPRIAGTLGDLAQRRTREERAKWEAEVSERVEKARLDALRDNDPAQYVEEVKRLEAERQKAADSQAALFKDFDETLNEMFTTLPKRDQEELAGKTFGEGFAGRKAALKEFATRIAKAEAADVSSKDRAKWEKEREAAIRKELLAELNGKEPAPDTGGGAPTPGALTWDEFNRNKNDRSWRLANRERVNQLVASTPVPKRR